MTSFFGLFLEIKFLLNIFVYARPYIDGVPTHSIQQVAVYGHGGQNVKSYLKKEEKIKAKYNMFNDYFQILTTG
jgi:hypothetical protein